MSSSHTDKKFHFSPTPRILVTGGAGYIGTHVLLELLNLGYACVVIDNYDNSSTEALRRIRQLAPENAELIECPGDLADLKSTVETIKLHGPYAGCIHFAGFKAVGESVRSPLQYYYNNVTGSLNLLAALESTTCNALVFSSSCTVYGDSANVPIKETERIEASSPYGRTKVQIEQILQDYANSGTTTKFQAIILRYFNPVGAHPSGKIGEDPKGLPNNLLPFISQVAMGYREKLNVFGTDYPTRDGTGVRDYVHVMDVARAHVLALEKMIKNPMPGKVLTYNIGTGKGTSVLEFIKAFEWASEKQVPYTLAPRRIGDVAEAYCDPSLAEKDLGFKTQLTLDDACRDAWKWQNDNPNGYRKSDEEVDGPRKALAFKIFL